jgi:hypothetical protein
LRLKLTLANGSDGHQHVNSLGIAPATFSIPTWDEATARKVVAALLPTDTIHVSDFTYTSAPGEPEVVARTYRSAALAATFKSELFVDGRNGAVQPGTFWVECVPGGAGAQSTICDVGLGGTY